MPKTNIAVYQFGRTTASFVIPNGVTVTNSPWTDCVTALSQANYKHLGLSIRAPGKWSSPGTNVGFEAASTKYSEKVLGAPHVHGGQGVEHRAAIGYTATPAKPPATHYEHMKIYIGEFS
jgi:hypothetical protein